MNSIPPIRLRAAEEGSFEIPWWGIPLVLIILYACLFSGLGAIGLVGPDEPRYAAIARAMAETHDWITPRLWGTPWFEKPVLYYWTAGIAMRIFGVSEFAARLPSALAGLLAVIAVAWTALRSYGIGAAWYSLLMLPTSVAMIGFSRAAGPDMLFAALLTASMAVAVEMLQTDRPGAILRIAFGFFLGAAVLAKGPAAVILAGGATLLWAAVTRHRRAPFRFLHPLVIAVFCATALPWYVFCALRNPDFLRVFVWQHNFERYLTPMFEHHQPLWYYIPIFTLAVFPWCILAAGALWEDQKSSEWKTSPGVFAAIWALFALVFFTFSESKLPGYIVPAIPPAFLVFARQTARLLTNVNRRSATWMGLTGAMLMLVPLSLTISAKVQLLQRISDPGVIGVMFISLVGGFTIVVLSTSKKPRPALYVLSILVGTLVLFSNLEVLPSADSHLSARAAARYSLQFIPPSSDVEVYALDRNWNYGLNYYFGRALPERKPGAPLPNWLFTGDLQAIDLMAPGDRIYRLGNMATPDLVLLRTASASDTPRDHGTRQ